MMPCFCRAFFYTNIYDIISVFREVNKCLLR